MGLSLKELVELAVLDSIADHPVVLGKLMDGAVQWHELGGRSDVRGMMADSMHQMLQDGDFTVAENSGDATLLNGSEAAMVLHRAIQHPEMLTQVEITVTERGKATYKKLAHRYYNG